MIDDYRFCYEHLNPIRNFALRGSERRNPLARSFTSSESNGSRSTCLDLDKLVG